MNLLYYLQFYFNSIFSFIMIGSYTAYLDLTNKSLENRIQNNDHKKMITTYKKIVPLVSFNLFISLFCLSYFFIKYIEYFNCMYYPDLYSIPKFIFFRYFVDVPFYFAHKLFHTRYLYKYHKIHHIIKAPVGISAFYMHPIDFIFGNIIPIFVPFIFLRLDYLTIHLWIILTIFNTVYESHGGFTNLSEFHDIHHKQSRYNFGTNVFMDNLFKTKKELTHSNIII